MPRPPVLPTIDWKEIHKSGKTFKIWLKDGENADHVKKMKDKAENTVLTTEQEAYLESLSRTINVVIIAEDWCGDVVRHVPVLERMAKCTKKLRTRYITREQHPDVFVRFLTNGGEAIPKFVFLSNDFVECGNWGPMPADHRRIISRGKAAGKGKEARERVSALYKADPNCEQVVREFFELVEIAAAHHP